MTETCGSCVVHNGNGEIVDCSLRGRQHRDWPACDRWFGMEQLHAALYGRKVKEKPWRPISTVPRDGSPVEVTDGASTYHSRWALCDRGWSVLGVYAWVYTPSDFDPVQWRPK